MSDTTFCGRTAELAALDAAFREIQSPGHGAALVLLLGDSGVGKTRLVREFYRHLATTTDLPEPAGYWPDDLDDGINPDLRVPTDPAVQPPYLWLGISCREHNDGLEGLDAVLSPHIEPMLVARARRELGQDAAKALAKGAVGSIPLVGPFLAGAMEASGWFKRIRDTFSPDAGAEAGPAASAAPAPTVRRINENVDTLIDCLADLLDEPTGAGDLEGQGRALDRKLAGRDRIPAVIFLDDAQRLGINPAKTVLVQRMLAAARERGWPLLLIAAHWHGEWMRDSEAGDPESFAVHAASWARAGDPDWSPLHLGVQRGDIYRPLLASLLPGLTLAQQDMILDRAGGNPRLIAELAAYARENPRLFDGLDPDAALTAAGEAELRAMEVELEKLIRRRINAAPAGVRAAAGISALQGLDFLGAVTVEAARLLGLPTSPDDVAAIEQPHALARADRSGIYAFTQSLYRDVALSNLPNIVADPQAAKRELANAVLARLGNSDAVAAMDRASRNLLHHLALALTEEDPDRATDRSVWLLALAGDAAIHHDYATAIARLDEAKAIVPFVDPALAAKAPRSTAIVPALLAVGRVAEARAYTDWRLAAWSPDPDNPSDMLGGSEFDAAYADISRIDGLGPSPLLAEVRPQMEAAAQTQIKKLFDESPGLAKHLQRYQALDQAVAAAQASGDPEALAAATRAAFDAMRPQSFMSENDWYLWYSATREKRQARLQAALALLSAAAAQGVDPGRSANVARQALATSREDFADALRYAGAAQVEAFPHAPWNVRGQALVDILDVAAKLLQNGMVMAAREGLKEAMPVANALLAARRSAPDLDVVGQLTHARSMAAAAAGEPLAAFRTGEKAVVLYDEALELEELPETRIRLASLLSSMAQWGHQLQSPTSGDWTDDAIAAIRALPDDAVEGQLLGEFTEFMMAACRAWFEGGGRDQGEDLAQEIERRMAAVPHLYTPAYRAQISERLAALRQL